MSITEKNGIRVLKKSKKQLAANIRLTHSVESD